MFHVGVGGRNQCLPKELHDIVLANRETRCNSLCILIGPSMGKWLLTFTEDTFPLMSGLWNCLVVQGNKMASWWASSSFTRVY